MCIYTMSIHSIYLVSDLEGSDNGDPLRDRDYLLRDYLLPLAVIHDLVTVGTPGRTERFQV
jgi:hypothetical protein